MNASELCLHFQKLGFETYWVGGAVRDMVMGHEISDVDFTTQAKPEEIKRILAKAGLRFFDVGEKFGTIGTILPEGKVEITTFRSESEYKDSRHPKKVKFELDVLKDLQRRDFTVNALLFDPANGEVIDHVGGLADIKRKELKFVGEANKRIKEDPLRLLRAVRFAAKLNFKIANLSVVKKNATLIKKTSAERIKEELDKIFGDPNYLAGILLLDATGLLKVLFPEVDNLKKVKQTKLFHAEGSAFQHTTLALEFAKDYDLDLRYAVFLHDIGKVSTGKKVMRNGRLHMSFLGHAQKGAAMFLKISKRLRFSAKQTSKIHYLIFHHMDLLHLERIYKKTLIKWARKPYFTDLIRLRIADSLGAVMTDEKGKAIKKDMTDWWKLIKFAEKVSTFEKISLATGDDVMKILKLKPGPKVGKILSGLKEKQIAGKIKNREQALLYVKSLDNKTN